MERPVSPPATPEEKSFTDSVMDADPLRALFDLKKVESLRHDQQRAYDESLQNSAQKGYSPELSQYYAGRAVGQVVSEYVGGGGYSQDSPDFEKVSDGLMGVSILNIPEEDWAAKFKEGSTTELDSSGRDLTRAAYEDISGKSYFDQSPEHERSDEEEAKLTEMRERLDGLREKVAEYAGVLQGRLFGNPGPKYREAYQEYNSLLVELGKLENQSVIDDTEIDAAEKKHRVVNYLLEEQAKLRALTVEKVENTKIGRFVKKFGDFMNRGNLATRIAKGVGVGIVIGAVGATVGGALGVAGAGAIGVGAVGLMKMGTTFARTFAMADAKAGRGMAKEARGEDAIATLENDGEIEADNYVERLAKIFGHQYEADTSREQQKRRKSVRAGLGGVAIGLVVGGTAGVLIADHLTGGAALGHDPLFGNHGVEATDGGSADGTGTGADQAPGADDHSLNQEWHQEHQQILAEQQAAQAAQEAAEQQAEQALNAKFYIQPGEGGIHFFDRLGLSEAQWYQVQGNLLNQFPQDFYQNPGQAVRIAHSGQLTDAAREYIKSTFGL